MEELCFVAFKMLLIKLRKKDKNFSVIVQIIHKLCCVKVEKYSQNLCANLVHFCWPDKIILYLSLVIIC